MIEQKELFTLLGRRFANRTMLNQKIADLLSIETKAVERRASGETSLPYVQLQALVKAFGIAPHELYGTQHEGVFFNFINLDVHDLFNYGRYMDGVAGKLERFAARESCVMKFVGDEIPIFHFMPFTELTYFKLYMYMYQMVDKRPTFESFMERIRPMELNLVFDRIYNAYSRMDSIEIWDKHTVGKLLRQIRDFVRISKFERSETTALLLDQVEALSTRLQKRMEKAQKENGSGFMLYLHESLIRQGYMILESREETVVFWKTDIINSMSTTDARFVGEAKKWFDGALNRSNAISMSSERVKLEFFNRIYNEIETTRKKIS